MFKYIIGWLGIPLGILILIIFTYLKLSNTDAISKHQQSSNRNEAIINADIASRTTLTIDGLISFSANKEILKKTLALNNKPVKNAINNSKRLSTNRKTVSVHAKLAKVTAKNVINMKNYAEAQSAIQNGDRIFLK